MTTQNETSLSGVLFSWTVAAGVACLAFVMLTLLGDISMVGRLFIVAIIFSALGIVLMWSMGSPLPAPNTVVAQTAAPIVASPVVVAPAPTAAETADWRQAEPKATPVKAAEPVAKTKPATKPAAAPKPTPAAVAAKPEPVAKPAEVAPSTDGPARLAAARDGGPDDLKKIKGVGPKLEAMLHGMGFYHFDQIGTWSASDVAWADENLQGFKGRVTRDDWVGQAKALASGEETEFSKKVDKGGVY